MRILLFAASVAIILAAFVQRFRVWRLGRRQGVFNSLGARITNALTLGAATSRVKNDRFAGVMHWCIYASFIVLTLVTLILALDDYLPLIFGQGGREHAFLRGPIYKGYSLVDCVSFLAMKHHGITEALTNDRHFEQEQLVALLRVQESDK